MFLARLSDKHPATPSPARENGVRRLSDTYGQNSRKTAPDKQIRVGQYLSDMSDRQKGVKMKQVTITLTETECEELDSLRGGISRSDYLRLLITTRYQQAKAERAGVEKLYQDVGHAEDLSAESSTNEED